MCFAQNTGTWNWAGGEQARNGNQLQRFDYRMLPVIATPNCHLPTLLPFNTLPTDQPTASSPQNFRDPPQSHTNRRGQNGIQQKVYHPAPEHLENTCINTHHTIANNPKRFHDVLHLLSRNMAIHRGKRNFPSLLLTPASRLRSTSSSRTSSRLPRRYGLW